MTETPLVRETRREVLEEAISLLDLAIRRTRASKGPDPELKSLIQGALEAAKQELVHLGDTVGTAVEDRREAHRQTAKGSVSRRGEQRGVASL